MLSLQKLQTILQIKWKLFFSPEICHSSKYTLTADFVEHPPNRNLETIIFLYLNL